MTFLGGSDSLQGMKVLLEENGDRFTATVTDPGSEAVPDPPSPQTGNWDTVIQIVYGWFGKPYVKP